MRRRPRSGLGQRSGRCCVRAKLRCALGRGDGRQFRDVGGRLGDAQWHLRGMNECGADREIALVRRS